MIKVIYKPKYEKSDHMFQIKTMKFNGTKG